METHNPTSFHHTASTVVDQEPPEVWTSVKRWDWMLLGGGGGYGAAGRGVSTQEETKTGTTDAQATRHVLGWRGVKGSGKELGDTRVVQWSDGTEWTCELVGQMEAPAASHGWIEVQLVGVQPAGSAEAGRVDVLAVTPITADVPVTSKPSKCLVEWHTSWPVPPAAHELQETDRLKASGLQELKRNVGAGPSKRIDIGDRQPHTAGSIGVEVSANVWDTVSNTWHVVPSSALGVGDIIKCVSGDEIPADCVLLWSTAPAETMISPVLFNGDKRLLLRRPVEVVNVPMISKPVESAGPGAPPAIQFDPAMIEDPDLQMAAIMALSEDPSADISAFLPPGMLPASGTSDSKSDGASDTVARNLFLCLGDGSIDQPWEELLRGLGHLLVPPPRADDKFKAQYVPPVGSVVKTDHQQLLPARARLVFTDAIIAMVVYTGADSRWVLRGGAAGAAVAKAEYSRIEARTKAAQARAEAIQSAKQRIPQDVGRLERQTGIKWSDKFTDVPDDGNCLMHAIWLGLTTLLEYYPSLRVAGEPPLYEDPADFRHGAFERLRSDPPFMQSVEAQIRLWLELDAYTLSNMVEDFFMLPHDFQTKVVAASEAAKLTGGDSVDVPALCQAYVDACCTYERVGNRTVYVPLGEVELMAICRLYNVRLQTIKSEKVCVKGKTTDVDPRGIPDEHVLDRGVPDGHIVRILNVNTNRTESLQGIDVTVTRGGDPQIIRCIYRQDPDVLYRRAWQYHHTFDITMRFTLSCSSCTKPRCRCTRSTMSSAA